jgi:cytochrome b subunit of formate dehydrogenase
VAASGRVLATALRQFKGEFNEGEEAMLWTLFVILLVLWLLGLVSSYTLGGFIHILLVVALVVLIINLVSGRRTVV